QPDDVMEQLLLPDGRQIAYRRRAGAQLTRGCAGIMFLCGFRSDMGGTKAEFLDSHCAARGLGFLRFDYSGHGRSSGDFTDGTIGRWAEEAGAGPGRRGGGATGPASAPMGARRMCRAEAG